MKIAIAGLGAAGTTIHLPAVRKLPKLEMVGATDLEPKRHTHNFPVFASLNDMLEATQPQLLIVATPTERHFEQCRTALEFGCHVLCEKPYVDSLAQAQELNQLAAARGLKIAVNNEFRFMQIHQAAHARIGQPGFGRLVYLDIHQTFRTSPDTERGWRGDDPRRTCKEFGTHAFDLARFFYGADPISIHARMPRPLGAGGPDYLNLIDLRFADDRYARITLDRLSRGQHRYLDIRLDGEEACVETSLGGKMGVRMGLNAMTRRPYLNLDIGLGGIARLVREESSRRIASDPLDLFPSATAGLLAAMVNAIETDTTPPCSGADNVCTLALMLAAYDSADADQELDLRQYIAHATQG